MTSRRKRNMPGCYNREGSIATVRVHIKARIKRPQMRHSFSERYRPSLIEVVVCHVFAANLSFTRGKLGPGVKVLEPVFEKLIRLQWYAFPSFVN